MTANRPVAADPSRSPSAVAESAELPRKAVMRIFLGAVILVLLAPSAVWIARDHSVWPWDQAWYGQVATDLWFAATHSLRAWGANMLFAMDIKPPAVAWIGQFFVPLHTVLGSVENALLFSILVTQAALLWTIFKIGEAISASRLIALAGMVFAAGTQAFTGLSHQMFVEPLQAFCVAWVVYVAAMSRPWPVARTILHLAAALLLGVAAKATTPVYCIVFVVYIAGVLWARHSKPDFAVEWRHWPSRILMCVFVPACAATGVWYSINFRAVWRHARDSSSGDLALNYGFRAPLTQKLIVWSKLYDQSFLFPLLGWAFLGVVVLAALGLLRSSSRRPLAGAPLLWLSAAQSVLLLVVFGSNIAVAARYMFALMPLCAVLLMGFCAFVPFRVAGLALLAVCTIQWGAVSAVALGARKPFANQFEWLTPPRTDRTQAEELTRVVQRTSLSKAWMNFIGVEEPWLNANSAEFFAAKLSLSTGVRSHYTTLGYAETSLDRATQRVSDFHAHFIATLDEAHQKTKPNFVNRVSLPFLRAMQSDPHFEPIPFLSREGILIFERH